MNKFILSMLVLSFSFHIKGQMTPLSNHHVFNALEINPAFAGSHRALSATLSYRNQWTGFDGSPRNYSLSVHSPIPNTRVGLGLIASRSSIGIFKETNILANYAYIIDFRQGKLSLGLGVGATIYSIAWDNLVAIDPGDELLTNNPSTSVLPALSMGSFYYAKKFFVGFSVPLFLSHHLDESSDKYKIAYDFSKNNYFVTAGFRALLSRDVKIVPSILIKYHPKNVVQFDVNTAVTYLDRFGLGLGYRNKNMLIGMLRLQASYQLRLAYSYDFNMARNAGMSYGSHEVVINYIFRYSKNVRGPRQF